MSSSHSSRSSRYSRYSVYSPCKWDFISPKCNCTPPLDCKWHVSSSSRNPRKAYWRCDDCRFFDWVGPHNMVWTGDSEQPFEADSGAIMEMKEEVTALKDMVAGLAASMKDMVKVGVIMFLVLIVVVKM